MRGQRGVIDRRNGHADRPDLLVAASPRRFPRLRLRCTSHAAGVDAQRRVGIPPAPAARHSAPRRCRPPGGLTGAPPTARSVGRKVGSTRPAAVSRVLSDETPLLRVWDRSPFCRSRLPASTGIAPGGGPTSASLRSVASAGGELWMPVTMAWYRRNPRRTKQR